MNLSRAEFIPNPTSLDRKREEILNRVIDEDNRQAEAFAASNR